MKTKYVKRLLVTALTTAMLTGSVLPVFASGVTGTTPVVKPEAGSTTGSSSGGPAADVSVPAEDVVSVHAGGSVSVAGAKVENTMEGSFIIKSFRGAAVITPIDQVKAGLGMGDGQTPHILAFDLDVKKSARAMDCVNAAVSALGGSLVSTINVSLDCKQNGRIISWNNGSAAMMLGLPETADLSKTYFVVCVQPGGVVTVLNDMDTLPGSVTFEIKAGLGAYAVVAV